MPLPGEFNVLPRSYCAGRFRGALTVHRVCLVAAARKERQKEREREREREKRRKKRKTAAEGSRSLPSVINKDRGTSSPLSRPSQQYGVSRLGSAIFHTECHNRGKSTNTKGGEKGYLPVIGSGSTGIFKRDTEILPSWNTCCTFFLHLAVTNCTSRATSNNDNNNNNNKKKKKKLYK